MQFVVNPEQDLYSQMNTEFNVNNPTQYENLLIAYLNRYINKE